MNTIPIDPRWNVCEQPWQPERNQVWESLCTLGNGYLGVRGHPDEAFDAGPGLTGAYVAGVFAPDPAGIPELVNLPNFFAAEILFGRRRMRMAPGRVSEYIRQLDMRAGVLRRSFVYSQDGRDSLVCFERFTSLVSSHIAAQSVSITPLNWGGRVEVKFFIDGDVKNLSKKHLRLLYKNRMGTERVLLSAQTLGSEVRIGVAFHSRAWVRKTKPPLPQECVKKGSIGVRYATELECGQRATFDRVISVYTSRDPDVTSVERSCLSAIRKSRGLTYGKILRSHKLAWQRQWKASDIEIDGPEDDQRAIRFSVFQLVQACSRFDPTVSIGAKALSGESYRGHVFWDTEIFMLPFFTYTDPKAARRLLIYRLYTLDGARRKARDEGHEGAMFAWESAGTGEETCPRYVPDPKTGEPVRVWCGEIEQHISADVVYGAHRYLCATGDREFRDNAFHEIAVETARFWASRVSWNEELNVYEVRDVIGPDEYHEHVDNNAFTNYAAAWNLRTGAESARALLNSRKGRLLRLRTRLGLCGEEPERWETIAERLYVPFDRRCGLHEQHQGFFKLKQSNARRLSSRVSPLPEKIRMPKIWASQVLKQADIVMLMMLWPDQFSRKVKKADWEYYEPRTTHDSSLSTSVHSIVASDLNLPMKAYDYFRMTAFTDLHDRMGNAKDGLHAAALGGTWQAVVRGFLQLRVTRDGLSFNPRLPIRWLSLRLRLRHRGKILEVKADRKSATVS